MGKHENLGGTRSHLKATTAMALVKLSAIPRAIAVLTGQPSPSYLKLWNLAVQGSIPVETTQNYQWRRGWRLHATAGPKRWFDPAAGRRC
jgi:hypothetical protein